MTYSIVARDANSGQMGVAVQSHWFSVGSVVTWGAAGVGVVATQAFAEPSYGPLGLDRMRAGMLAPDALQQLLGADEQADRRQVAMLDRSGGVAAHTGANTLAASGHVVGDGFSVQANMMLRDTVPEAMASAFVASSGGLADRLLAALDAAEGEGGDIRGRQSAAMLIVGAEPMELAHQGTVMELRIEDHDDPLAELRRLVAVKRAYHHMNEGDAHLAAGDFERAGTSYVTAQDLVPDNIEFTFWRGVMMANFGRIDEAREFLDRAFGHGTGDWRELLKRLPAGGLLSQEVADQLL